MIQYLLKNNKLELRQKPEQVMLLKKQKEKKECSWREISLWIYWKNL